MPTSRLWKGVALMATCVFFGGVASAASFSFTGTFSTDDQLQDFQFSISGASTVTTLTWSYAGGTNQAGTMIPEGGFDPWLSIFDSTGNLLFSNDNGTCGQVPMDSVTGSCFDSYLSQSLNPGTYTLVLSESDNQPAGTNLSDGYTRTGQGNFTGSFGCSNGMFCDINADNRTGDWAVDIDNVDTAAPAATTPEPASVLLTMGGLAGIIFLRRRGSTGFSRMLKKAYTG